MFILSDPIPLRSKGGRIDKGDITKSVCAYVCVCCVCMRTFVCECVLYIILCVLYICVCVCVCVGRKQERERCPTSSTKGLYSY